jgi:hypothetical protein
MTGLTLVSAAAGTIIPLASRTTADRQLARRGRDDRSVTHERRNCLDRARRAD